MKKVLRNILMMAFIATSAIGFTSCEDEKIASTLEGTWRGNMYISSYYGGHSYNATYTEITFLKDPMSYAKGSGYWVDYYSDAPWDYVANHIDWKVEFGDIFIYFVEEGTSLKIYDYRLRDDRFCGSFYDGDNKVDFELFHTSSPNWGSYSYWGYDGWYSRTRSDAASDSVDVDKPVRYIRFK